MSVVKDKSFGFAIQVTHTCKYLIDNRKEYTLSKQFLRSGTAIGALVREAQNAESKADFVHKMAIAQKECGETIYWIELLKETGYLDNDEFKIMHNNATDLLKMLRSIIITTKRTYNS